MPQSAAARMKFGQVMHELKADNQKKGKARGAGGKKRPMKQMLAISFAKTKKK